MSESSPHAEEELRGVRPGVWFVTLGAGLSLSVAVFTEQPVNQWPDTSMRGWPFCWQIIEQYNPREIDVAFLLADLLIALVITVAIGAVACRLTWCFDHDRFRIFEVLLVTAVCAVLLGARQQVFTVHVIKSAVVGGGTACLIALLFALARDALQTRTGNPLRNPVVWLVMSATFLSIGVANCFTEQVSEVDHEYFPPMSRHFFPSWGTTVTTSQGWPFKWRCVVDYKEDQHFLSITEINMWHLSCDLVLALILSALSGRIAWWLIGYIRRRKVTAD